MSEATWKSLFGTSRDSFLEFVKRLQGMPRIKRKKRAIRLYVILQTRDYRKSHALVALSETLMLLRCLEDLGLGSAEPEIRRRALRSFCFILMRKTTPQDVEMIEYLLKTQVHSALAVHDLLMLRIYDFLLHYPGEVKGKIKSADLLAYEDEVLRSVRFELAESVREKYQLGRLLDWTPAS